MYEQFIKLWLYQDQLKWRRFNWAITIESAAIAGGFLKPGVIGLVLMAVASLVLILLSVMVSLDKRDAVELRKIIARFHEEAGVPDAHILSPRSGGFPSGTGILLCSLVVAFCVNSAIAVLHLMHLSKDLAF
jgi:hypothetical protein